jgi:5-methyltetrahydrofolate--homocysteine methyltransferase
MPDKLVDAIVDMREVEAVELARQMLETGADPIAVLDDCRTAMETVGKRFEEGQYFIPELILAGEMMKQISAQVKPHLKQVNGGVKRGKVVVGTVAGDIHDIGKDIVVFMLDVNGFDVYDLGVDVPPQSFVDKIAEVKPQVVALSGFLSLSYESMKVTVDAIKAAGLKDSVKIMIGGGTVDEQVRAHADADAVGHDAMAAVRMANQWIGG